LALAILWPSALAWVDDSDEAEQPPANVTVDAASRTAAAPMKERERVDMTNLLETR
jgi:hypothetical protein